MTDDPRWPDGTPKMAPRMCVECGIVMNATTGIDDALERPTPGSVSLCLNCGHLALFDDNLMLREATAEENADPEIQELRRQGRHAAVRYYHDSKTEGRA